MGVINLSILVKRIMGKISGAGYIKDTDYASSSKGGTIKIDSTYATDITSGGKLKAKEITAEAYSEANDAAFISKATLDNVLASQSGGGLEELYLDTAGSTATTSTITLSKSSAGYKALIVTLGYGNPVSAVSTCVIYAPLQNKSTRAATLDPVATTLTAVQITLDGTSVSMTGGSASLKWYAIYGIK